MTSLEFIEKEIEFLEDMINMDLALVEDEFDLQEIANKQKRLEMYQQIKAEIEAWYVVKPHLRFEEHSRTWIYLDRISKDCPSYSVIEKELLKNIRSIAVVTKEGDTTTVKVGLFNND